VRSACGLVKWVKGSGAIADQFCPIAAYRAHPEQRIFRWTVGNLNQLRLMEPKYEIEFGIRHGAAELAGNRFATDDPVACEEFVKLLLEKRVPITAVKHEGRALEGSRFDRMLKTAAGMLAAEHLCASLGIDSEEERVRFGFTT
jgi:hypothetical protein